MKQLNLYLIMVFLMSILLVIIILLTVAFLTLMERKFLGYLQTRKGPNKVGMMGIMQPFADAVKLMMKEFFFLSKLNYLIYLMSPIFSLGLILMMWMIFPFMSNYYMMSLGLLYLLCCFSLGVYGLMLSGWASNSMYAMLGSIRSLAQSISYEVSLSIIMIIPMLLIDSLNYMDLLNFQENMNLIIYMWPLSMMFMFSMMAELNRTPFDFSESESELVSGFNVEYMSSGFILLFLSEYASILILSFLFVLVYMGGSINMFFMIKMMIMVIMVVWIRGTLPRFRYDLLMKFCWVQILPFTLNFMFYMIVFKAIF